MSKRTVPMVAFLRGVNLGKRQVKSADLQAAFRKLGFADARTLIASGNVLFSATPAAKLCAQLEAGLADRFGFEIDVILRTRDEVRAIVESAPFAQRALTEDARPHGVLFAGELPKTVALASVPGEHEIVRADARELYLVAWRQPEGGIGKQTTKLFAQLNKAGVSTARAWTTLVKAAS